ncbi:MAG TPA: cell filamentation protein Fic [Bdellovibrionales bacterium]|nr:MAG: hypothetical protein A2X97_12450 [Bdellovibrionales bacterium GWA1_52_35]HAR43683.1 cell filamentation protein Fic [Bdellovibrionales bacterium]HCM41658.1 cell filamentation protein Fic [Bdellovibrionales bacterium]
MPLLFSITESILNFSAEINRILGRYEGLSGEKPQPKLRRLNRIRTIQGSLAIEGNSLSLEQITALLDGKRVLGPKKDIFEAQNANEAYEHALSYDPFSVKSMLEAHQFLMKGIIADAGKWRSGAVGIMKGTQVSHIAPKAQFVQGLIKDLLKKLRTSKTSPLITSCVFHHEFELIHPFSDGNGRMGRLWQHVLLTRFHPAFEFIPIESIVRDDQRGYYAALEKSDTSGESTAFIEFMLSAILKGATEFIGDLRVEPMDANARLRVARDHFDSNSFSRKDYQSLFKQISAPTASRDLQLGVAENLLSREGDKATARYCFVEPKDLENKSKSSYDTKNQRNVAEK